MAFTRAALTVLLLSVACRASNVPVFLWGDLAKPNLKSNPLTTTTSPAFSDILSAELVEDPFIVVFIEKTLSIEDFSRRNAYGQTSFPYLQANMGKSVYMASVENAFSALTLLADPVDALMTLTEDGLVPKTIPEGKFIIISLEDAREGESRSDLLLRHNDFMKHTMLKLKNVYEKVVGIYTARDQSWSISHRVRRQAAAETGFTVDGLGLYANITLTEGTNTVHLQGLTSSSSEYTETTQKTTLTFNTNSIVLNFRSTGGYWYFESVTLDAVDMQPSEEVFSLIDFSYRCAQSLSFGNDTRVIRFDDIKIQPFFHNTSGPVVFGDSLNCVGFFSAPIWSGLFVVFILLSITFYGIIMMMDIRTMDRFDDPKGKTITINAGE